MAAAELVAWYCGHPDVHPDTDQFSARDHLVASEIDELISTSRRAVVSASATSPSTWRAC